MSIKTEPERLLTIEQAAELTNYEVSTIVEWINMGMRHVCPGTAKRRPPLAKIRIKASVLWDWVDSLSIVRVVAPSMKVKEKVRTAPAPASDRWSWEDAAKKRREAK